jgi:hypothetical protein
MKSSLKSFLVMTVFVLMFSVVSKAEIFTAYLSGAQEVPAVATTATGYARIVVDTTVPAPHPMTFTVVFNGLSSAQNNAHIHAPAAIGASTGVAINFGVVGGTSGTISGSTTITATQLSQLRAHLGYVNVHSANFTAGEIRGQLGVQRPVDNDGDGRTDLSVLRFPDIAPPGEAPITWWNSTTTSGVQAVGWGDANRDFPVPGDFDGDAKGDITVYRAGATAGAQGAYYILLSSNNTFQAIGYGLNGDQNVARDYDGDGKTDMAVFRKGVAATDQATWWIRRSTVPGNDLVVPFGVTGVGTSSGDTPIPGDYDGDGKFDIAVYRFGGIAPNNNFIILRSSDGAVTFQAFGNFTSDYILAGDYDGDGKYDLAIARTGAVSTSPLVWWVLQSSTGTTRTQTFGRTSDLPAQGDYDGDARTDLAVYRAGATDTAASAYWVFRSFDNTSMTLTWGVGADFSVNTFDIR